MQGNNCQYPNTPNQRLNNQGCNVCHFGTAFPLGIKIESAPYYSVSVCAILAEIGGAMA